MGIILETVVVSEGKDIIKNQQVSNGISNPAKCVSCAWYMGQLCQVHGSVEPYAALSRSYVHMLA